MSHPSIKDLAPWPATQEEVTVAAIQRSLLVWAKVYEARLFREDGVLMPVLAAAAIGHATAGILLGRLNAVDPAAADEEARRYWAGAEWGEITADALDVALDAIDPELAEAVFVAVQASIEASR